MTTAQRGWLFFVYLPFIMFVTIYTHLHLSLYVYIYTYIYICIRTFEYCIRRMRSLEDALGIHVHPYLCLLPFTFLLFSSFFFMPSLAEPRTERFCNEFSLFCSVSFFFSFSVSGWLRKRVTLARRASSFELFEAIFVVLRGIYVF